MSTAHLLSLTAVVIFSFLVSLTSGERTSDHFFNVPKVPQLISMLMYDSNLSGNPNEDRTHLSELLPAASPNFGLSTEENEFDNTLDDFMDDTNGVDDDDDVPVINYTDNVMEPTIMKRQRYHNNKQNHGKRSSLSDLIRRLMALKGNSFTDGRITMMRFGTGRRR